MRAFSRHGPSFETSTAPPIGADPTDVPPPPLRAGFAVDAGGAPDSPRRHVRGEVMTHHATVPEPDGTHPQDDDTTPGGAALRIVRSRGEAPDEAWPRSTASPARAVRASPDGGPASPGRPRPAASPDGRPAWLGRPRLAGSPDGRTASPGRRRRRRPRTFLAWFERGRRTRAGLADAGMATAEYAIATLAAVGFAGLLVVILKGNEVKGLLLGIIRQALSL